MVAPRKPVIIKLHPDRRDYVRAENDFLRAIGLCVNTWAFVDRELYRIFRAALRSLHPASTSKEASALYYKKRTLGQHIKMVDDKLALVLQPDQLQSEWRPLQRRIKDATQTRNIVAHHPALRTGTARAGKAIYRYSIYIEPFEQILNQPYPGLRGKSAIQLCDLENHAAEVEQLTKELYAFLTKLNRAHQRIPK